MPVRELPYLPASATLRPAMTRPLLVAAGMVIAAVTFRGGRPVRGDLPPSSAIRADVPLDGEQKLRLVVEGAGVR